MPSLEGYLIVSALLFAIGAFGFLSRRNAILMLICIELMLNAVNLSLVAFNAYGPASENAGAVFSIMIMAVAAAEVTGEDVDEGAGSDVTVVAGSAAGSVAGPRATVVGTAVTGNDPSLALTSGAMPDVHPEPSVTTATTAMVARLTPGPPRTPTVQHRRGRRAHKGRIV